MQDGLRCPSSLLRRLKGTVMSHSEKPNAQAIGWQLRGTTWLFESCWYNLRQDRIELPSGDEITYTYLEHPGAAFVVPVTSDGQIVLLHSYRYAVDEWCWEMPGGNLGDNPGMGAEEVARLELKQEMGAEARRMESLGEFYIATGQARIKSQYFIGYDVRIGDRAPEPAEKIDRVRQFGLDEVLTMVYHGGITEGETALALLLAVSRLTGHSEFGTDARE